MNIYEKNPNFRGKPSFKNWCNDCRRYGNSIAECRQKQQDNQTKPQKNTESQINHFIDTWKKSKFTQQKIHSNNRSVKPFPINSSYSRQQSPYRSNYRGRSPNQRISRIFSQNRYSRSNSRNNQYRNNYSRSNSNRTVYSNFNRSSSHSNSQNIYYSQDQSRKTPHIIEKGITPTIEIEIIQLIQNRQCQDKRSRDYSNDISNYQRSNYINYHHRPCDSSQYRN